LRDPDQRDPPQLVSLVEPVSASGAFGLNEIE
jgi:hypothetical protein